MDIFLECLPCMLRQTLEVSRISTERPAVLEAIMTESCALLEDYRRYPSSPELARALQKIVKKHTGLSDPYAQIKERDLQLGLRLEPLLRGFLREKENALYWALKISAAGNMLDSALFLDLDVENLILPELARPFDHCDLDMLDQKLCSARSVLIIADNTGETVFDKLLAERLGDYMVTYAVRGAPILNDATEREARAAGLDACAGILSTGCDAPGALLPECTPEFRRVYESADVVISKGQGNCEALMPADRDIFYLLKAKCPKIAELFGVSLYGYVFEYRG